MKDFPIPVRSIGPGSQVEDETLDYMPMPQGMETFRAPPLPEPEQMAGRQRARAALREALVELEAVCQGGGNRHVDLAGLVRRLPDLPCQQAMHGHSAASANIVTVMVWLCNSQRPEPPGGAISP